MKDFIDVGSAPTQEDCAQVGTQGYANRARQECRTYIGQLRRRFGDEPQGAKLSIKSNVHDFGTYFSVMCHYDPVIPASVDYAFRCEGESPEQWDAQARQELAGERK